MMVVLFTYVLVICCKAEVEVERLDLLKASRMKEIAFKRQAELEEIFARAHIEIDPEAAREKIMALIDSGNVEPTELLTDMDNQIANAKEEALSRRDILDKVEKWMSACEEESWLDDYNRVCIVSLSKSMVLTTVMRKNGVILPYWCHLFQLYTIRLKCLLQLPGVCHYYFAYVLLT